MPQKGDVMSPQIKYAYKKHNTWIYRRVYPKPLQPLLGTALKQSLKTGDATQAKTRVAELNQTLQDIKQCTVFVVENVFNFENTLGFEKAKIFE